MEEQPQQEMGGYDQQPQVSLDAVLAEYKHRKTVEAMIGPAVSLAVHLLLFLCAFLMYSPQKPVEIAATVEINSTEEEEPEEIEDMEELELPPPEEQVREVRDVPITNVTEVVSEINTTAIAESVTETTSAVVQEAPTTDFTTVLNVQGNKTNFKISGLYAGRTTAGRRAMANRYGGRISGASEACVNKALEWLKKTQNANGSWGPGYHHAMTGLCLLTYLAHGEDTNSRRYGKTVAKAIQFLTDETIKRDAIFAAGSVQSYTNGIVAYALSEAYGMTKLPMLKLPMEKSLSRIVEGQQRGGGFDYGYAKGSRWDLSVAGWQFQAMKAGYVAGAEVKGLERAIERSLKFLKKVCYKRPKGKMDRPFGYATPGGGSDGMQGAGTLCLQLLGEGNCEQAKAGCDFIHEVINNPKEPKKTRVHWDRKWNIGLSGNPIYYWYYCTQAMFHAGGAKWKNWHANFTPQAMKAQASEGYWEGPGTIRGAGKPPVDKWYSTALTALSLQVYYRYLPSYKLEKGAKQAEATELNKIDEELGF